MITTFQQLNHNWNADPNAPYPTLEWQGDDLELRFYMNRFKFPEYDEWDIGVITFASCARYRVGSLNDEGWYLGQSRFKDIDHEWGEFYAIDGDLRLDQIPDEWHTRNDVTTDLTHFLFYFRDEDFECDARSWIFRMQKAEPDADSSSTPSS